LKPIRSALLEGAFAELKGRGARSNRESRFAHAIHIQDSEHLDRVRDEEEPASTRLPTTVTLEQARSIISRNQSPDIPFDQSINPYRGCEHGCVYCYARPSHAYLDLSPGLDFETRLFAKDNAAQLLEQELRRPGYQPSHIALGANTDPYQPIERDLRITRSVLEVLAKFRHPVAITTKSALVLRDLDLLRALAQQELVHVWLSIATLDATLARSLEPRAAAPARRLQVLEALSAAGVPAGVIVAPVIPALTDPQLESVLEASARAGARRAGYVLLRLPREVHGLFAEWLEEFAPLRAAHVMSLHRQLRGGQDDDGRFGARMKGTGLLADLLRQRFALACRRLGMNAERMALDTRHFRVPELAGTQQSLF